MEIMWIKYIAMQVLAYYNMISYNTLYQGVWQENLMWRDIMKLLFLEQKR